MSKLGAAQIYRSHESQEQGRQDKGLVEWILDLMTARTAQLTGELSSKLMQFYSRIADLVSFRTRPSTISK